MRVNEWWLDIRSKNQFGDKFTNQARGVLARACEEARQYTHSGVGTEHLLLGLLHEEKGLGGQVLRQAGVSLEKTRDVIKQLLVTDRPVTPSDLEQQEAL